MTGHQRNVRDHRPRYAADRQGLRVRRLRRQDPGAVGHRTFTLVGGRANTVVLSGVRNAYRFGVEGTYCHLSRDRDGR